MKITIEVECDPSKLEGLLKLLSAMPAVNSVTESIPEPNWEEAPDWAVQWAVDSDGNANWYSDVDMRPAHYSWVPVYNYQRMQRCHDKDTGHWVGWATSLRRRPGC